MQRKAASPAQADAPRELVILVAEDDPDILLVMSKLLSKEGHQVISAADGEEALDLWEKERPHLILMDVQMPKMDGLQATRNIREREKKNGGRIPIYGLTAHAMKDDINRCLEAGMTGHIAKPVNMDTMRKVLRNIPSS